MLLKGGGGSVRRIQLPVTPGHMTRCPWTRHQNSRVAVQTKIQKSTLSIAQSLFAQLQEVACPVKVNPGHYRYLTK